jgi:hypothetical protein
MTGSTALTTTDGAELTALAKGPTMDDFIEAQAATPRLDDQISSGDNLLLNEHQLCEFQLIKEINELLAREETQMKLAADQWVLFTADHRLRLFDYAKYKEIVAQVALGHLQSCCYEVAVRHSKYEGYDSVICFRKPQPPQPSRGQKLLRWVLRSLVKR